MSHMLDSLAWTGEVPWHGLGRRLPKHATVDEMIRFGGLDWQVVPRPLFQADENGTGASVPGYQALTRSDRPNVTLAIASEGYGIVQNATALSLAAAAVGPDNACAETCGALDDGRRIFLVLNLPEAGFDVADERIEPYIICYAGHDASTPVGFRFTPVRVVCQNTLSAALNHETPHAITIRHTRNAAARVERAAAMIASAREYFGVFHHVALDLVKRYMSRGDAEAFAAKLFPTYKAPDGRTLVPANQAKLVHLFAEQRATTDHRVAGTRWGMFNAVTALVDHNSRGSRNPNRRMQRTVDGSDIKDTALNLLLAA